MPNQHTKKKERAAAEAKAKLAAEQAGVRNIHVQPLTEELFAQIFGRAEREKPKSSCQVRAESQPHVVLLAQDNLTPNVLRYWISLARQQGVSADKIAGVESTLRDMEKWRTANPLSVKLPD